MHKHSKGKANEQQHLNSLNGYLLVPEKKNGASCTPCGFTTFSVSTMTMLHPLSTLPQGVVAGQPRVPISCNVLSPLGSVVH